MMSTDSYLLEQLKRHPSMEAQDVIKMCYQASFGAEHIVTNKEMFTEYLHREWDDASHPEALPLYEEISADFCRVNLAAWKQAGLPLENLVGLFFKGIEAYKPQGDKGTVFAARMATYRMTLETVWSPEKMVVFDAFLQAYNAQGLFPVRHSEAYRIAENPHYRLIPTKLVKGFLHE